MSLGGHPETNRPVTSVARSVDRTSIGAVDLRASDTSSNGAGDLSKTLALIEFVAKESDRNRLVASMAQFVASEFPSCTVRCGLGSTQLKRYYDSRLGWLGPASDLFQEGTQRWEEDATPLPTRPSVPNELQPAKRDEPIRSLRLNIDDEVGLGRCVLWIEGGELSAGDRSWLRRALPMLRSMIWHRSGGPLGHVKRLVAGGGTSARIYIGLACLLLGMLAVWPVSYRVRCNTVVRPEFSRVISAPFEATLESSNVQPGDTVKVGEVLLSLDGRPLRLELETLQAKIGQVRKERDIAMVGGRIAEAQQAKLRIRELSRQHDLVVDRLQRLSVVSPIDGVVVLGDLSRSIGATLETGQAMMEVAPLEQMVVELEVPEYDIGYVKRGTVSRVRLTANSGETIERSIDTILPTAELRDDQNVFVARIAVENPDGNLRPGMRGDAIAYGPIRPWLWSHARTGWEQTLWWIGY